MKLSEAIRLGAMLHPQGFSEYRQTDNDGRLYTCALGAAFEAGLPEDAENTLDDIPASCPACAHLQPHSANLIGVVIHLNDGHRWTREQIADWVQTIEDAQAVASERQQALESATSTYAVARTDG